MLGHQGMKATNYRISEILIKTPSRKGAAAAPPTLLTSTIHHTHTHKRRRNQLPSVETDTAITWKARKTPLATVLASNTNTVCICVLADSCHTKVISPHMQLNQEFIQHFNSLNTKTCKQMQSSLCFREC